jgi:DNA-binding MarR family transcriptional regulator
MGPVTTDAPAQVEEGTRWLDPGEREAWLSFLRVTARLPPLLDTQLDRSAGLTLFEYSILAMLSEQADGTLRMRRLAEVTNASPSRLSHAARKLERRHLLTRRPDPADGRCILAVLTPDGRDLVARAAPGHVSTVRGLLVDVLTPDELREFRRINDRILERVDPQGATHPGSPGDGARAARAARP